ncbi:MAG: CBS domain-containing protein [Cyanobacteria bacterium P01_F01_bin.53]
MPQFPAFRLDPLIDRHPLTIDADASLTDVIALMAQPSVYSRATHSLGPLVEGTSGAKRANGAERTAGSDPLPAMQRDVSCMLVLKHGQLRGIITEKDIVRFVATRQIVTHFVAADVMSEPVRTLYFDDEPDIFSAIEVINEYYVHHVPVVGAQGELIGLLSPRRLRSKIAAPEVIGFQPVKAEMDTDLVYALAIDTLEEIVHKLAQHSVSCVVIVQSSEDLSPSSSFTGSPSTGSPSTGLSKSVSRPVSAPPILLGNAASGIVVGIVTARDIVQCQYLGLDFERTQVQTIMSAPLFSANEQDTFLIADQTMQRRQVRQLLVVNDDGYLLGVIAQKHMLQALPLDPAEVLMFMHNRISQLNTEKVDLFKQLHQSLGPLEIQKNNRLQRTEEMLCSLALGVGLKPDDNFWRLLVSALAEALQIDYVLVGRLQEANAVDGPNAADGPDVADGQLDGQPGGLLPLAIHGIEDAIENFEYDLAGELHQEVMDHEARFYLEEVRSLFPQEQFLQDYQIEAYLGVPLRNAAGEAIGLLIGLHRQPLEDIDFIEEVLSVFAVRASAELERQDAAKAQQESQLQIAEQAALLDVANDAIFVCSLERRILYWNKGAEKMYGWRAAEALTQPSNLLLGFTCEEVSVGKEGSANDESSVSKGAKGERAKSERAKGEEASWVQVREQGHWQGERVQVTRSGQEIVVMSRWTLVNNPQGEATSVLIVNTDITEKKQLETQFLRAQRLESLGTLASGIAHDLNNILTPIMGVAQLLPMQLPEITPAVQRELDILEASAQRGAEIINQVLSFARGSEGTLTLLDLKELVLEIQNFAQKTFPKSIAISSEISPHLWCIKGDATKIYQVLMNLFVNARDAMPKGGRLKVEAINLNLNKAFADSHLGARVGPYILVTVADTGMGISPENLERIFEPFFTTKKPNTTDTTDATTKAEGGTGLGLSTVHGIVRSHGGFVTTESQLGKGTQFNLYFPAMQSSRSALVPERLDDLRGQGELVLVVDDEAAILEIARSILEAHNYRVMTVANGMTAIAQYTQHQADISVVLMDIAMPSLKGTTAIQIMQRINPELRVIVTSGLPANQQRYQPSNQPGTTPSDNSVKHFLKKPYSPEMLLAAVNTVLQAD